MRLSMAKKIYAIVVLLLVVAFVILGLGVYGMLNMSGVMSAVIRQANRLTNVSTVERIALQRRIAVVAVMNSAHEDAMRALIDNDVKKTEDDMEAELKAYVSNFDSPPTPGQIEFESSLRKFWNDYVSVTNSVTALSYQNTNNKALRLNAEMIPFWDETDAALAAVARDLYAGGKHPEFLREIENLRVEAGRFCILLLRAVPETDGALRDGYLKEIDAIVGGFSQRLTRAGEIANAHAVTKAIIKQLEEAGIPRRNLVLWDRREMQLNEVGYTEESYPGIKITGTECQDADGGYINKEGRLYSEDRIDKNHYFYADIEGEYDAYTMPFMVNGGKHSYFTKICTEQVTKIINVPILKNAGTSVTLCMKNLAFGAISNTARLHQKLWHETCAYVCAFPPLRDKVVLNIVDGLIGCFDGGPSANPQFICQYNTLMAGSDPVAVDCIGYETVIAKRIEEGIQSEEKAGARKFMELAQDLKLGVADRSKIQLDEISLA